MLPVFDQRTFKIQPVKKTEPLSQRGIDLAQDSPDCGGTWFRGG